MEKTKTDFQDISKSEKLELMENYRVVVIRDYDYKHISTIVLLNKKHKKIDFENAIASALEIEQDNIMLYGFAWNYVKYHLKDFDYIEMEFDNEYVDF